MNRELSPQKGTHVYLEAAPGLQVLCLVTDVKFVYGKTRLQLVPLNGKGQAWVNASSVTAQKPEGR